MHISSSFMNAVGIVHFMSAFLVFCLHSESTLRSSYFDTPSLQLADRSHRQQTYRFLSPKLFSFNPLLLFTFQSNVSQGNQTSGASLCPTPHSPHPTELLRAGFLSLQCSNS